MGVNHKKTYMQLYSGNKPKQGKPPLPKFICDFLEKREVRAKDDEKLSPC